MLLLDQVKYLASLKELLSAKLKEDHVHDRALCSRLQ